MRRIGLVTILALALVAASCHRDEHEHGSRETAAPSAPAAPHAGGLTQPVAYGDASGYLALPAGGVAAEAKKPALIVIQEWWGVDDWIREQSVRFASRGYVALAPDLYRGRTAKSPDEAHELMRGMPEDRAMADLRAAVDYLAARPDVDPDRIGVIGWCMGGGWALQLAMKEPRLNAAVINYGHLATDPSAIANIRPAVLGNFGAEDRGIPAADVKAFETALKQTGHDVDVKIYEGAGHAFMNPNNKEGYVPAAAADAQARIDAFLKKHLGP